MNEVRTRPQGATRIHDCIGVGFGPSNMALAIALEERGRLDRCLFLETAEAFDWQPGMMIDGADIQHNPLRDLVTPRNPTSPYGFLSYLQAQGRLFDYLNLAAPYPPRSEYAGYVRWVGDQLRHCVRLGTSVRSIAHAGGAGEPLLRVETEDGEVLFARTVSFAVGRSPSVPDLFCPLMGPDVVHLGDYVYARERWLARPGQPHIAVLGGSQSAAEILLDFSAHGRATAISRSFAFKQKDLSAFTECIYYPEFVDYFHGAGTRQQNEMTRELWRSNYGAADPDVIARLNMQIYEQKVTGRAGIDVRQNTLVKDVETPGEGGGYRLHLEDKYSGAVSSLSVDGIVLATGFRNFGQGRDQEPFHPLLAEVADAAAFRGDGGIEIDRGYRLRFREGLGELAPIFINGLCEASHGFGDAGSFSLLSVRSDEISREIIAHLDSCSSEDELVENA